jgi:hypothetical protein
MCTHVRTDLRRRDAVGVEVAEAAEAAEDPHLRALLRTIADDEARHAALGWALVRWAAREAALSALLLPYFTPGSSGISVGC